MPMTKNVPAPSEVLERKPDPGFCQGIQYFAESLPGFEQLGTPACLSPTRAAIRDPREQKAIYQTLLAADALRYLTLQITATKSSGHPGGFASAAEVCAAMVMLGYPNIVTEVGHHAPGFYSAMFLDTSLEYMGIHTVQQLGERFREMHGLLGHLSGAIPGLLAPAGPLGQGQHFAMAGALLHPTHLFPLTLGDGGLGEPYILSAMQHFHIAYPRVTNFLPILIWNGYSQEHHSMVATWSNEQMRRLWRAHGFKRVLLVDARDFDDRNQPGDYVDSTLFSWKQRMAFTGALLEAAEQGAKQALGGELTVLIIKQLKGAGVHTTGAKSHTLYPHHTLENSQLKAALQRRALTREAWALVRENFRHAGGGVAARTVVTESELPLPALEELPLEEFEVGEPRVPTTALGFVAAAVGHQDARFLMTNSDGNEASGLANINEALTIRHPTRDKLYAQGPHGQVYEPLSEDACAGLAAGIALFGGRSLWSCYESFAINGLPIWQTVTQAMAELRHPTPSTICLFTAGALEQGRNGWTHQRPEIEAYLAAMIRNGNVYPLFPVDANMIQAAYHWALETSNKGIVIFASKSALPVRTTQAQSRLGVEEGAVTLYESRGAGSVVFAVTGDMVLLPVFEAAEKLQDRNLGVRIVSVVNPRRLFRPSDVAWENCSEPDGRFIDDASFDEVFHGDVLIGVSGGSGLMLEPVLLRSRAPKRDVFSWRRGQTTADVEQLLDCNGLNSTTLVAHALALLDH